MKTCPKCGKQLEDGASFCNYCGAPLIETEGSEAVEAEKNDDVTEAVPEEKAEAAAEEKADSVTDQAEAAEGDAEPEASQGQFQQGAGATGETQGQFQQGTQEPGQGQFHQWSGDQGQYQQGQFQQGQYQQGQYRQGQFYQGQGYQRPYASYDPSDHTAEFSPADIAENKLLASMPYFFSILGIIAALMVPDSPFIRYHVKNEMRFLILMVLACIPLLVPFVGWVVGGLAFTVLGVLKIMAVVWVLQGKAKDIPIISSIGFLR